MKANNYYYNFEEYIKKDCPLLYNDKYIKYRKNWIDIPKKKIVTNFPMHLDIEIANICNLKCLMCSRTHRVNNNTHEHPSQMDMALFKKIVHEASEKGCLSLKFNGDCEPLILQSKFIQMLNYTSKYNFIDLLFGTNATLLSPELSENIINSSITRMNVSIDSPEKNTYEQIRVGAKFEKVMENICNFMKIRKSLKKSLPFVRAQMVVMDRNQHQTEDFKKLFGNIVDSVGFITYSPHYDASETTNLSNIEKRFNNRFVCEYLFQRLYIKSNGDIASCFMEMPDKANIIGNIKNDTIEKIWKSQSMQKLRKKTQKWPDIGN